MSKEQNTKIILDIINNLILLEDYDAIEFHAKRLKSNGDERLLNIIHLLKEEEYDGAGKLIEDYLASTSIEKELSELQVVKAQREKERMSERYDEAIFKKSFLIAVIVAVIMILALICIVKKYNIIHYGNIPVEDLN
jgi:hypothetical protein